MTAPSLPIPPSLAIRAVYLDRCESKLRSDFSPLLPGQRLYGQHSHRFAASRLLQFQKNEGVTNIQALEFKIEFNFVYKTPLIEKMGKVDEMNLIEQQVTPEQLAEMSIAAQIGAGFVANFQVDEAITPTQELMDHLANTTALFIVWPYWREYCQSTLMRMHLPPTAIPLINLSMRSDPSVESSTKPTVASGRKKSTPRSRSKD